MPVGQPSERTRFVVLVSAVLVLTAGVVAVSVTAVYPTGPNTETQPHQAGGQVEEVGSLGEADATILGNATDDNAGYDLADAGDVNGDGERDLIVSAPFDDTNGANAGAVYLFYGPIDGDEVDAADADVTVTGAPGDRAGWAVAAGDVNGDGINDVVIGAPQNGTNGPNSGAVYVVFGGDDHDGVDALPSAADATYRGAGDRDVAGYDVATVPDEGGHALLVGAPYNDSVAEDAGVAYLVRDVSDGERDLVDAAAVRYVGPTAGDRAGWAVSAAGDVNGDETSEAVVGAPRTDSAGSDAGAAYVLTTDRTGDVPLDSGLTLEGVGGGDRAGYAVAAAGDVNNDSLADVVVGAPYNDSAGNDSGAAYVVTGREDLTGSATLSAAAIVLAGESANDRAGWAVSSAGSVDPACDEFDDVLVGAPYANTTATDAGAAYVVSGDRGGDLSLTDAGTKLRGVDESDRAGWSVSGAANATGTGTESLLVGAPYADAGGNESGAAYLVESNCPVDEPPAPATPTESPGATPTESPTPPGSPTPTPTETDGPAIDIVNPVDEPTVRPDTPVWLEVEAEVSDYEVGWRVYRSGEEPGDFLPQPGPVQVAWPTTLYRTSFDDPGTYVVEAAVLDDEENPQSSVQWTVTVSADAPAPPTRENIAPDGETYYFEETGTWTVGVGSGEAPYRVAWWLAHCDVVESLETTRDTSTFEFPNNDAADCEPWPVVIDANGMTAGIADPDWDVTYEEPIAVEIVNTETDGEVEADVTNVGTETHDVDVELEIEEDGGYRVADATSVTLESGETERVTLAYEDDRDEFDVRVTAYTGDRTAVSDTATVTRDEATPTPDDGGAGNDAAAQNSLPAFRLGWAAGSLALIAGLVVRGE